ncbi:proline--tRNA ligase [Candidatus Woesearchaeota archaeon]|nr:proline--tRNA ligase [Candidatus Woesearchaeota archaeon]
MAEEKNIGLTVKKEENFSEWYQQVIIKSDLADYSCVSGCMIFRPACYSMWEVVQKTVDARFKKMGIQNAYFPLLIPEKLLSKEAEHVEGFSPEVAWVTHAGDSKLDERLAIRPTSETIMYDSYAKWIRSWRDLPLRLNQWNNVVRWEFKHPVALLRTREFLWNEGHTAFATQVAAEAEKEQVLEIYNDFIRDYMALYGVVGRKTEKEKFAGAEYTYAIEHFLPSGKGIQGPDFHHDGQKFAKAFDIKFLDQDGQEQYVWQNTFAITTRMLGVMIGIHGDNKGLVVPPKMAFNKVVIVPIIFGERKDDIIAAADKIREMLSEYEPLLDDREGHTPGWKFNEWELKGIPIRIEIGPKDLDAQQAVVVVRDTGEKNFIKINDLKSALPELMEAMHKRLYDKSKELMESSIIDVDDYDSFKQVIKDKRLVKAYFCGYPECEEHIKTDTGGAGSRCIPSDGENIGEGHTCVRCGNSAKCRPIFGKSY